MDWRLLSHVKLSVEASVSGSWEILLRWSSTVCPPCSGRLPSLREVRVDTGMEVGSPLGSYWRGKLYPFFTFPTCSLNCTLRIRHVGSPYCSRTLGHLVPFMFISITVTGCGPGFLVLARRLLWWTKGTHGFLFSTHPHPNERLSKTGFSDSRGHSTFWRNPNKQ